MHREDIRTVGGLIPVDTRKKIWSNGFHVFIDGSPRRVTFDDELGEVLVEQVADHLDQYIGLLVERHGGTGCFSGKVRRALLDALPLFLQPLHVGANVLFAHTF
ncbi:Uncharacterised protein [Mycobacteroides abscessus subsp. massiliense]|nr:Uncharacterised protein [Mycobacteroides abscessus subsp. massiliense]